MRQLLLTQISRVYDNLLLLPAGPTHDVILRLHSLLLSPSNYSVLFGRVHVDQRRSLEAVLVHGDKFKRRNFIGHWRRY